MKKLHSDQSGIAHLGIIAGVIVTVSIIAFGAYRVGQNNNDAQSQIENDSTSETVDEISVKEKEEQKADPVEIPTEEKELGSAPVEKKYEAPADKKEHNKNHITVTKVSAVQNGSVVNVSSRLSEASSGTCSFKLYQNGYDRMYSSTHITNSTDCTGQIDVSNAPTYSGWELHVWFDGDDKVTSGSQNNEAFPLTDPN